MSDSTSKRTPMVLEWCLRTFQGGLKRVQRDDTAVPLLGVLSTQSHGEVLSWKPDPLSVQQCVRVTYPGGIICLTEAENGIRTSPACEQISVLCAHAMRVTGHSFSPNGRHLGVTAPLGRFHREAGCQHIQQRAHLIDYSVDTDVHRSMIINCNVLVEVLKPFLFKTGVTAVDELERLHREATIEMLSDDFCGVWFFLSAWSTKHHLLHPTVH